MESLQEGSAYCRRNNETPRKPGNRMPAGQRAVTLSDTLAPASLFGDFKQDAYEAQYKTVTP